jgi:branched-chain amino acid transport system substrate-binding protein
MKRTQLCKVLVVFIMVIMGLFMVQEYAAAQQTKGELWIGAGQDLTGPSAAMGKWVKCGMELAAEQINAKGGINGKTLKILFEDDRQDPKEAGSIGQKFADDKKILASVGYSSSTNALAALPANQRSGLLLLSWGNTSPKLSGQKTFYRMVPMEAVFAYMQGNYAVKKMGKKSIAVMAIDSDATIESGEFFKKGAEAAGGKVVAFEMHRDDTKDYLSTLTKIRALNPDLIFTPTWYGNAALIARQIRELGMKVDLMGQDTVYNPELVNIGKDAVEGYWAGGFFHPDQDAATKAYAQAFKAKCGFEPEGFGATAYDTVYLIKEALEKGGESRDGVLKYMETVNEKTPFKGVAGIVAFNEQHDPFKSAVVVRIEKGKWAYKDLLEPVK